MAQDLSSNILRVPWHNAQPVVIGVSRGAALTQGLAQPVEESEATAFTLVELVAVIFTLAVLAALALPLLASPSVKDQQTQCLNNVKQLQMAWTSYAGDDNGKLALNTATDWGGSQTGLEAEYQPGQAEASWVLGCATNPVADLITHGLIYPYVGSIAPYKCPADLKTCPSGVPTLRSYSINGYMGGYWPPESAVKATEFTNLGTIASHFPPAMALVVIEENLVTINDGSWVQDVGALALEPNGYWIDSPAHHHLNACSMCFADGHCLMRKWTDKWVLADTPQDSPIDGDAVGRFYADPNSPDNAWVLPRCTVVAP
jgi:type II secretory pathway pseudopilin PulG